MNDQLIELETRLAFQDEAIDGLNQAVLNQQRQIERLAEQVEQLKDRLKAISPSPLGADGPERPPHY
ncbi:MAG: SlyX family protein [Gammaproteobacteria bacterium SHHR-1]|uniref:SlyX family protein n=1 Tax=Magnetovirga frankeli TaxID=947516 RepID=UPI0012935DB2|nr:SlyX family protein [gamma proteobacterium SS-5]